MDLSRKERRFIDVARDRIRKHSQERKNAEHFDKLHAVVRSTNGSIYAGVPFESSMSQFDLCAERHAINNMHYVETKTTKLDLILVAGTVPDADESVTTSCGACRHAIHEFSDNATVFCSRFVRQDDGWTMFSRIKRYTVEELYPDPYSDPWE